MTTHYKLYFLKTGFFLRKKFFLAWESSKKLFEEEEKKEEFSWKKKPQNASLSSLSFLPLYMPLSRCSELFGGLNSSTDRQPSLKLNPSF